MSNSPSSGVKFRFSGFNQFLEYPNIFTTKASFHSCSEAFFDIIVTHVSEFSVCWRRFCCQAKNYSGKQREHVQRLRSLERKQTDGVTEKEQPAIHYRMSHSSRTHADIARDATNCEQYTRCALATLSSADAHQRYKR